MSGAGFNRCRGPGQFYYHLIRHIAVLVHGDDFLVEADARQFPWVDPLPNQTSLTKKKADVQTKCKHYEKLYDITKNERNKNVNLIQATSQGLAEWKEKIKILQIETV